MAAGGCHEKQLMPRSSWLRFTWLKIVVMRSS
jgi:hypothetical protein